MFNLKFPSGTLLALISCLSAAQQQAYTDSENFAQAVGRINAARVGADAMLKECGRRYPDLQTPMSQGLAVWKEKEKSVLNKADAGWALALKIDPSLSGVEPYIERTIAQNLEQVAGAPFAQSTEMARLFCTRYFDDLASGIWRSRTPNAYHFLDAAP